MTAYNLKKVYIERSSEGSQGCSKNNFKFSVSLKRAGAMSYLKHSAHEFLLRGNNKVLLGEYKEAIFEFTKAIMADPDLPHSFTCRGAAKLEIRDYEGSISDCREALKLHYKMDLETEGTIDINSSGDKNSQINPVYSRLYLIMGISKMLSGNKEDGMLDLNCARLLGHNDAVDIMKTYQNI